MRDLPELNAQLWDKRPAIFRSPPFRTFSARVLQTEAAQKRLYSHHLAHIPPHMVVEVLLHVLVGSSSDIPSQKVVLYFIIVV